MRVMVFGFKAIFLAVAGALAGLTILVVAFLTVGAIAVFGGVTIFVVLTGAATSTGGLATAGAASTT